MPVVIEDDDDEEEKTDRKGGKTAEEKTRETDDKPKRCQNADVNPGNSACGNGACLAITGVEIGVAKIIEIHAADVEKTAAEQERNQDVERRPFPLARENHSGQKIGPDGGEIGDSPENEQSS